MFSTVIFKSLRTSLIKCISLKLRLFNFGRSVPEISDAVSRESGISDAVSRNLLPWTHYRELIRVEDATARVWYEQEAMQEMWSTRTLHRNIASQYYYRMLQSADKKAVSAEMHALTKAYQQDKLEFIKNPVIAEFLGWQQDRRTVGGS